MYVDSGDLRYDFGMVRLKTPAGGKSAGERAGYFGLSATDYVSKLPVTTAGYPLDKAVSETMWFTKCIMTDSKPRDQVGVMVLGGPG